MPDPKPGAVLPPFIWALFRTLGLFNRAMGNCPFLDDKHDDLPIKHCDFLCYVRSPEGNAQTRHEYKQVHSGMIPLSFLHVFGDLDE